MAKKETTVAAGPSETVTVTPEPEPVFEVRAPQHRDRRKLRDAAANVAALAAGLKVGERVELYRVE